MLYKVQNILYIQNLHKCIKFVLELSANFMSEKVRQISKPAKPMNILRSNFGHMILWICVQQVGVTVEKPKTRQKMYVSLITFQSLRMYGAHFIAESQLFPPRFYKKIFVTLSNFSSFCNFLFVFKMKKFSIYFSYKSYKIS